MWLCLALSAALQHASSLRVPRPPPVLARHRPHLPQCRGSTTDKSLQEPRPPSVAGTAALVAGIVAARIFRRQVAATPRLDVDIPWRNERGDLSCALKFGRDLRYGDRRRVPRCAARHKRARLGSCGGGSRGRLGLAVSLRRRAGGGRVPAAEREPSDLTLRVIRTAVQRCKDHRKRASPAVQPCKDHRKRASSRFEDGSPRAGSARPRRRRRAPRPARARRSTRRVYRSLG